MNVQQLFHTFIQIASADQVLDHIKEIWHLNRWSSFSMYSRSAGYVSDKLKEIGLDVEQIDLPMDGSTTFGDAVMPYAWNCEEGLIELLDPTQMILADRSDTPNHIGMWSPATPDEGIETELVILESGEPSDLETKDVEGKIIFTPHRFDLIRREASRLGALGVISSWMPYPDQKTEVNWIQSNTDNPGGWGTKSSEKPLIAISISPEKGEELLQFSADSTLRVRVKIKAELTTGTLPIITTVIPGQESEEEILLMAPLYGQGANYPAAGSAVLLECVRLLQKSIEATPSTRPRRSIRFLWGPKLYGPHAFIYKHKEILDRTICALYLESGAGNPDISWSRWSFRTPPVMFRHFSDGISWNIFQEYLASFRPQRFCEYQPFSLQGDVFYIDPAIGVPSHWLAGGTDEECRNTSADTPNKIDRRSCIDLTVASSALAYFLAYVGKEDIPQCAFWNYRLANDRIHDDLELYFRQIQETKTQQEITDIHSLASERITLRVNLESRLLQTMETLDPEGQDSEAWLFVQELLGKLSHAGESALSLLRKAIENRAKQLGVAFSPSGKTEKTSSDERIPIPDGSALGTITLDSIPYDQWTTPINRSPRNNVPYILSWWLVDETRTIGEIDNLVRMETDQFRECIPAWFTFLEKNGYVLFEEGLAPINQNEDPISGNE